MSNQNLKDLGLKVTAPRLKILDILSNAKPHHMSAEEIYKALLDGGEDIALATVYRVLTQFEAAGLVDRHYFEGGHSIFELHHGCHHDHLFCLKCNQVAEFSDPIIKRQQELIAREHKFSMTDHSLIIYGLCANCQGEDNHA